MYSTHTCTRATININTTGHGNTARAYSQWSNHEDNVFTITQTGDSNFAYLDLDKDDNVGVITQNGNSNHGEVLMAGDDNAYTISQTGNSKYAKMYAFGDDADSTVGVTQSGANDKSFTATYNCVSSCTKTLTITQYD